MPHDSWSNLNDLALLCSCQEMAKYRSKGDLGALTELERDNTEHVLDQQSRVRVMVELCGQRCGGIKTLAGAEDLTKLHATPRKYYCNYDTYDVIGVFTVDRVVIFIVVLDNDFCVTCNGSASPIRKKWGVLMC